MADNSSRVDAASVTETIASDDIGGIKHQRVKLEVGADGVASDVQPPDSDGKAATALLASGGMVWNGAGWDRARSSVGDASSQLGIQAEAPYLYNENTFDRQRGNSLEINALASAARTVTTVTPILTNFNARGIHALLSITAASGTGGLSYQLNGVMNGTSYQISAATSAITTTGVFGFELYPGASTTPPGSGTQTVVQRVAACLPRSFQFAIIVGNATSYTYRLDYTLIV